MIESLAASPYTESIMHLKRLEIYGYKSFATRTAFDFAEGITAIIGPNGSGKSNVADAIRWVLGEQSYRALRAQSTEDMIFSGSRQRARLGMAEVILTFDNTSGWIPIDYAEVTVGRRAYRSGDNEYLLNGNRVRYRDILDILGGAGLSRSTYAVIGQGVVDAALSLRPEARRALFEEAAGVLPHQRKKNEALKRIEETEQNLLRVGDILSELRPRATTLRRQAERAEEYQLLRQDLRELQRIWYGYQWQHRQKHLARAEETLKEQGARIEAQRQYRRSLERRHAQLDAQQAAQRQELEQLVAQQSALREQLETARRELLVLEERGRLYRQQKQALAGELTTLSSQREVLQAEITHAAAGLAEHETAHVASAAQLNTARTALAALNAARQGLQHEANEAQARLSRTTNQISEAKARLEQVAERRAALDASEQELLAAQQALDAREQTLRVQVEKAAEHDQSLRYAQEDLAGQREAHEAESVAARERLVALEDAAQRVKAQRQQLVERLEHLTRLRQESSGYYPGVREVLSADARLSGMLGTVASLMQAPAELEQAIESALGQRLQNVVIERWEDAEAAIAHLKRTRAGWATFLPLDTLRARPPLTLKPEKGVVGIASSLVRYEPRLQPVFDLLLGSVIVVDDLATARRLLGRHTGASLLVTLGGETAQPSGAVSGGARRQTTNLLGQEREWRDLPQRIAAQEEALSQALRDLADQQAALIQLRERGKVLAADTSRLRAQSDQARAHVLNLAQELTALERERQWHTSRLNQTRQERDALAGRSEALAQQLATAQQEEMAALERLGALRAKLADQGDEALQRQVAELETRAAVAQRTMESQRALLASHRKNLEQFDRQISDKQAQLVHLESTLQTLGQSIEVTQRVRADAEKQTAAVQQQLDPLRAKQTQLERERRQLEQQLAQSLERLREAELEGGRAELERDRANDDLASLAREIEVELGPLDLPESVSHQLRLSLGDDIVELPSVEALPARLGEEIRELKARLRRLGDINPNAPHEYEQLLDRQTFLQTQMADLRGAIASLHEVIQELDTLIERDFGDTIQRVDQAFQQYFARLFRGGSAKLVLTDPANLTTTGVDIIAHPPGKRAQNLSLLSGGERALTAVALLFALLKANPVPFCFLDEVDAALDEANVARFRELLQEHARTTQFVVITHNRATIDAASTIYGISMGEQGVSQCISLKLDEGSRRTTPEFDALIKEG